MSAPDLIEQLRAIGLPMTSRHASGHCVAWTTDEAKASKASELGATVNAYTSTDPRFNGWEVSARDPA